MTEMTLMELAPEDRFVTAAELMRLFPIIKSRTTLYKWIDRGCPVYRPAGPGTSMYFIPAEVAAWIKRDCWDASTAGESTDVEAAA